MKLIALTLQLTTVAWVTACSGANFNASDKTAQASATAALPQAQTTPASPPTAATASTASEAASPAVTAPATTPAAAVTTDGTPPPGYELTMTVKAHPLYLGWALAGIKVFNKDTQAVLPLSWKSETQTVPGGCSTTGVTDLSFTMSGLGMVIDMKDIGTCAAPVAQINPRAIVVSLNFGCVGLLPWGTIEFACGNKSTGLKISP